MMADLFSIQSPLLVCYPNGEKHVVASLFPREQGIVYFVPWWRAVEPPGMFILEGDIQGEGPWKIGNVVIRLMSCGDTDESIYWSQWQQHLVGCDEHDPYLDEPAMQALAMQEGRRV